MRILVYSVSYGTAGTVFAVPEFSLRAVRLQSKRGKSEKALRTEEGTCAGLERRAERVPKCAERTEE